MVKLKHFGDWVTNSMLTKNNKKTPLLIFWTRRYLLTLIIGLILIAVVSIFWIRHNTIENQLELTKLLAQDVSERLEFGNGKFSDERFNFETREKIVNNRVPLHYYIKTEEGMTVLQRGGPGPQMEIHPEELNRLIEIPSELTVQKLTLVNNHTMYAVVSPFKYDEEAVGAVIIVQEIGGFKNINPEEYQLLALLLIGLAILGWFVIYFLSRKMARPVEQVAAAAGELMRGNYDIQLNEDVQEKELHELIMSFKEMTNRLQQLEALRTELLAGVTHELKTPITSVSALIQAVNDDVISDDKKKEFLTMSLKEAKKLQAMVEDLLDFNRFSAGTIKVKREKINLAKVVKEIVYQWEIVHQSQLERVTLTFTVKGDQLVALADHVRLQQIIVNLLNNSLHAVKERDKGEIAVELYAYGNFVVLDVIDNGYGISEKEQPFIFERFYRGENKKHVERGLGLGLPFSLLLAKAQGGDLILKKSTGGQTIISLQLPSASIEQKKV